MLQHSFDVVAVDYNCMFSAGGTTACAAVSATTHTEHDAFLVVCSSVRRACCGWLSHGAGPVTVEANRW